MNYQIKNIAINRVGREFYNKAHGESKPELLMFGIKIFQDELKQKLGSLHNYNVWRAKQLGFKSFRDYLDNWAQSNGFEDFLDYHRKQNKIRKMKLKSLGLCTDCGQEKDREDRFLCLKCRLSREKTNKEYYILKRDLGFCVNCGDIREDATRTRCNSCRRKENIKRRENYDPKKRREQYLYLKNENMY